MLPEGGVSFGRVDIFDMYFDGCHAIVLGRGGVVEFLVAAQVNPAFASIGRRL